MPNGKPGDHPYTDIVLHGLDIYAPDIDSLVREIARLGNDAVINATWALLVRTPDLDALRRDLTRLKAQAISENQISD